MAIGFNVPHIMQSLGGLQQQEIPAILQNMQQPTPQPVEQKKPGLFGQGGKGWMALGIIGDALQAMDGGQGTYMPAMIDMREQAAKERARLDQIRAQAEAKTMDRRNARDDWVWQQNWQRQNPAQTALQKDYEYFKALPGNENKSFEQFMSLYKPQFVSDGMGGGGFASYGGGLPSGYDPNEWEVVDGPQGGAGSGQPGFRQ